MITISRRTISQLKTVLRLALRVTRGSGPPLVVQQGPDGLRLRAVSLDAGVEYTIPGEFPAEQIVLPWEFLSDCEGKSDEPVTIESSGQRTLVKWRDGSVPQRVQYPVPDLPEQKFPPEPEQWAENPARLLKALADACQTTDPESVRFALGSIQLQGEPGKIVATDGRQLLTQSGFQFDWAGDILVPANRLYGCRLLPDDQPVFVGRTESWFSLRVGSWTFHQRINTGARFPQVEDLVPRKASITARFEIPRADRVFLAQNLPKMPGESEYNWPVTVDLNGKVVLRSRQSGQAGVTELVLSRSTRTGEALRFHTNRRYLLRAAELGFEHVQLVSPKAPVLCQDEHRQYLWALLDPESVIDPTDETIRIESPVADKADLQRPATRRKTSQMTSAGKRAAAPCHSQGEHSGTAEEAAAARAIDQAVALRDALREAAANTAELIRQLRRDKSQARRPKHGLASRRQIEAVRV